MLMACCSLLNSRSTVQCDQHEQGEPVSVWHLPLVGAVSLAAFKQKSPPTMTWKIEGAAVHLRTGFISLSHLCYLHSQHNPRQHKGNLRKAFFRLNRDALHNSNIISTDG